MPEASYLQSSFRGGEASKTWQGRYDRQDHRTYLAVSLNGLPTETESWTRRPGTQFAGTTRSGLAGREIKFDFKAASPYNMEFTDGFLRFRSGAAFVTSNDPVEVTAITAQNPAAVNTSPVAHGYSTGDQGFFVGLGTHMPRLQNRLFSIVVNATGFLLYDPITGQSIDGATLALETTAGLMFHRVRDLATPYSAGIWASLRSVQADTTSFLLQGAVAPQALTVTAEPTVGRYATFALDPAVFNDGPYLDPFVNGVLATPNAKTGIVTITLSFPAYVSTAAYAKGAFVTSASINYTSLVDQNVGNAPASSPSKWQAVSAGTAIGPQGFQGSDVGRLVRLFSEPPLWDVATAYAIAAVVSYNPSGLPGQTTYWTALTAHTGKQPGLDLTNWTLTPQGASIWSWGKITSLTNMISGTLAGSSNIGDMTGSGGLAAAFDGTPTKNSTASATKTSPGNQLTGFVGKSYSGASDQRVGSVTVFPSADLGFGLYTVSPSTGAPPVRVNVTINLRGKATPPAIPADGTLLGSTGLIGATTSPVTIASGDTTTAWKYVWVEVIGAIQTLGVSPNYTLYVAQLQIFSPPGGGTGNGVNVEILGPPLLYTTPIRDWRLGVYSNTTGWPTCGTYHQGRLWLSGAIENRIDACVANGILGGAVDWAPTDQYGTVAPSNAISYTFAADDTNPIFWMVADLKGIVCGTQAGEWLLHAPTPGSLSPFNISAARITRQRAANIEPRRTEHTTVFVQSFQRKVMEYFDDVYSGRFTGQHLSRSAKHLTAGGVDEIAYQQELCPIVWARAGGRLIGCTYKRDTPSAAQEPSMAGWHRHTLGSGRTVEGLCVGPSVGGDLDSLSLVTNDPATGIRHVEIITDLPDEEAALADVWYLDDAVVASSVTSSATPATGAPYGGLTINGLWHLNGKIVSVMAGGLECGDPGEGGAVVGFPVSNGSCFVPYGDGVSAGSGRGLFTAAFVAGTIGLSSAAEPLEPTAPLTFSGLPKLIIGFGYTSDGQIVRPNAPAESGARSGPAFGKVRRTQTYAIQVENTRGLQIGTKFTKLRPVPFKSDAGTAMTPLQTFTGIARDSLEDDYGYDGMLCWRQARPFPANVIAIGGLISTQDS